MFNPAANPPSTQTGAPKFNWRKSNQTLKPNTNIERGAKIFRNMNGDTRQAIHASMFGEAEGHWPPIQLSQLQCPKNTPGKRIESQFMNPSGPSFDQEV